MTTEESNKRGIDINASVSSLSMVNAHYQMKLEEAINLHEMAKIVKGNLHLGRPTMLTCRILAKRVQFFPNGAIQLLGGKITHSIMKKVTMVIYLLLRQYNSSINLSQMKWTCNNIVFKFLLFRAVNMKKVSCSKDISFEPELFPAMLLSKWRPAHVTLFHNGHGMITGVKDQKTASSIIHKLCDFLISDGR